MGATRRASLAEASNSRLHHFDIQQHPNDVHKTSEFGAFLCLIV
jgi:hypothetical protein